MKIQLPLLVITAAFFFGSHASVAEDERNLSEGDRCLSRISIAEQVAGSPYVPAFASDELDDDSYVPNPSCILISIHGSEFSAQQAYNAMENIVEVNEVSDCLIVAPQFYSTEGEGMIPYAPGMITWRNQFWRYGSRKANFVDEYGDFHNPRVSPFDVLDQLVERFANRNNSRLTNVILFGFSAGGQLVQRYSLYGSPLDGEWAESNVKFSYFVVSPSSYMYLDSTRPQFTSDGIVLKYKVPTAAPSGYNDYQYGMGNIEEWCSYFTSQNLAADTVLDRYRSRNVFYVVGGDDTDKQGFDSKAQAMIQGRTRAQRAIAFDGHVNRFFDGKSKHELLVVDGVGHDRDRILQSDDVTSALVMAMK